jgi:hypothetical protein
MRGRLATSGGRCINLGFADADLHKMVSTNTARVLGIEVPAAA